MSKPTTEVVKHVARFHNILLPGYPEAARDLRADIDTMARDLPYELAWLYCEALRIIAAQNESLAKYRKHSAEEQLAVLLSDAIEAPESLH